MVEICVDVEIENNEGLQKKPKDVRIFAEETMKELI